MRSISLASIALLALAAPPASAQDPAPGSVLIFPSLHENVLASIITVTNTNTVQSTGVRYQYVNAITPAGGDPFLDPVCQVTERFELLTVNDTKTVRMACHNPFPPPTQGYLVVDAGQPLTPPHVPWSYNHLIGSEWVADNTGATFTVPAISYRSRLLFRTATDIDLDGRLDFDGIEYDPTPGQLFMDTFLASIGNDLVLLNLTGGLSWTVAVTLVGYNDNEFPIVVNHKFVCWFDQSTDAVSLFAWSFAALLGTPHDPTELDVDCDGVNDLETGWVRIMPMTATHPSGTPIITDPGLEGTVTRSTFTFERGRPLWRSQETFSGEFFNP